jgi:cobalt-zinc-cadmium efflux system membrane fusion protein
VSDSDFSRTSAVPARLVTMVLVLAAMLGAVACSSGAGEAKEQAKGDTAARAEAGEAKEADGGKEGEEEEKEGEKGNRVTLTEAAAATANIAVEPARAERTTPGTGVVEVPGQVEFDRSRVALVSPRTPGRIERLLAVPGDRVRAGQTVALLYSPAFITAQNDLLQARRRSDVLEGTADAEGARALLAAARRRIQLLGVTDATVERIEVGGEPLSLLPIDAPFAGSIIEMSALAGAAADAGTALFKIADLSVVHVAADIPERAAFAVRAGQDATIRIAGAGTRSFSGRVVRVSDQMDAATRTVEAFVQVPNAGRVLKPGMSASVVLRVPGGTPGASVAAAGLAVPASAIVTDGGERYVFVEVGPRSYERREVQLAGGVAPGMGPQGADGGRVVVVAGLAPGDRVVVRGAFTLKSELAKASFAGDEH